MSESGNNIVKSQCLGSILLEPALGPHISEREVYVEFIYLSIYPPIASKKEQGGNR